MHLPRHALDRDVRISSSLPGTLHEDVLGDPAGRKGPIIVRWCLEIARGSHPGLYPLLLSPSLPPPPSLSPSLPPSLSPSLPLSLSLSLPPSLSLSLPPSLPLSLSLSAATSMRATRALEVPWPQRAADQVCKQGKAWECRVLQVWEAPYILRPYSTNPCSLS